MVRHLRSLLAAGLWGLLPPLLAGWLPPAENQARAIVVWHGETQRVGHLGDLQDDFNLMGRVEPWREVDQFTYRVNGGLPTPLAFRAFRRLAEDGDFNADIPIGLLRGGTNTITLEARFRDGGIVRKDVKLVRGRGASRLPFVVRWRELEHFDQAGQAVDGEWRLTPRGLRTARMGYDRLFLIGERTWQDYEVHTTFIIHEVSRETTIHSGGNGVGVVLRFAGHVTGGPRHFGSGQPKWGYQPFGAIGWLRWRKGRVSEAPHVQFYPGDSDQSEDIQAMPVQLGETYAIRFSCQTLPDAADGRGVTRYRFRIWRDGEAEPTGWTWERVQVSRHALRQGGLAFVAHHVDVTFGDVNVQPLSKPSPDAAPAAAHDGT